MGRSWREADPWVRRPSGGLEGREGVKKYKKKVLKESCAILCLRLSLQDVLCHRSFVPQSLNNANRRFQFQI